MFNIVRKFLSFVLVISIVFLQSGCSAFASSRQPFTVTSSERDAQIYINGDLIGSGTVKTSVPKDKSVSVMVKKEGFYSTTREIGTKISSIGMLDLIGGCIILLPLIGLAFPGSHELDQSNISVVMEKAPK